MFYAALSRANEEKLHGANKGWDRIKWTPTYGQEADTSKSLALMQRVRHHGTSDTDSQNEKEKDDKAALGETNGSQTDGGVSYGQYLGVDNSEWALASRAARTASWGAIFYLITTDILGPYTVPWALSQMGWSVGVVLYFVFGALAFYAGIQMWQVWTQKTNQRSQY